MFVKKKGATPKKVENCFSAFGVNRAEVDKFNLFCKSFHLRYNVRLDKINLFAAALVLFS